MNSQDYILVYDAAHQSIIDFEVFLFLIAGLFLGLYSVVDSYKKKDKSTMHIALLFTSVWLVGAGYGFGYAVFQRAKCKQWAQLGDYKVVEGAVENFNPDKYESFTVKDVAFKYSDYDRSIGAFNNTSHNGGANQRRDEC